MSSRGTVIILSFNGLISSDNSIDSFKADANLWKLLFEKTAEESRNLVTLLCPNSLLVTCGVLKFSSDQVSPFSGVKLNGPLRDIDELIFTGLKKRSGLLS